MDWLTKDRNDGSVLGWLAWIPILAFFGWALGGGEAYVWVVAIFIAKIAFLFTLYGIVVAVEKLQAKLKARRAS